MARKNTTKTDPAKQGELAAKSDVIAANKQGALYDGISRKLIRPKNKRNRDGINEEALARFSEIKNEIDKALARLAGLSADHFNVTPEEIHWGHVGDVAYYLELLTELTNMAFNEEK